MNLQVSQTQAHLNLFRSFGSSKNIDTHSFKVTLSQILEYSNLKSHKDLIADFALDVSPNSFVENAKAYGFQYSGINCAYVMTKVLTSGEHSFWLAIEIHQYKESWGFDAGEISWLYLKNKINEETVEVEDLKLFPLKLFTDYEDVEIENAMQLMGDAFVGKTNLICSHSRVIQNKFSPQTSIDWLRDLATLGYCLSQFGIYKVQHEQTKNDIKNAFIPYLINIDGQNFKALSLLIRMADVGVENTFWFSFMLSEDNSPILDKFVLSFGQYASDLTVCKAPARNLIEASRVIVLDDFTIDGAWDYLIDFGVPDDQVEDYANILKGVLTCYFDKNFISRLMLNCVFAESETVDVSDLKIVNQGELASHISENKIQPFSGNKPLYFSKSSFALNFYIPNQKYSLVDEDYIQPVSLAAPQTENLPADVNNEYDFRQPDFNEENKIEKLFSKPQEYRKPYQKPHRIREQFFEKKDISDIDTQLEIKENKRTRTTKSTPDIKKKFRFRMLINQQRKEEIEKEIQVTQNDLKENGTVSRFIEQLARIPEKAEDINTITVEQIHKAVESNNFNNQSLEDDVVKVKRGRPPKKAVEAAVSTVDESVVTQPEPVEPVVAEPVAAAEPIPEKKKRGRPPKKAVEAAVSTVNESVVTQPEPVEPVVAEPVAAAEPIPEKKKRGRPPKKAKPDVIGQIKQTNSSEPSVFNFGAYEIKVSDHIAFIDKELGVESNYPLELLNGNQNYLFNCFAAHGLDKFVAVEVLEKIGCKYAEYSFHDLQRALANAPYTELTKYNGFERYVFECEYEMATRI